MENDISLSEEIPNLIAAFTSKTKGMGYKNDLPWGRNLTLDFKWLNKLTVNTNKKIALIMGRKTFMSIGKPLLKRINIVISQNFSHSGVITFSSVDESLLYAKQNEMIPVFFGGRMIYEVALKNRCKVFFTIIENDVESDVFFPEFKINLTNITREVEKMFNGRCEFQNEKIYENGYCYSFFIGIN